MDNGVAGGVGCGVGFTITTLGNDGAPVVEVVGANRVETVVKETGDGVATSMVQVKTRGGGGCLGGKVILSGRMSQKILPAVRDDRDLGDAIVSRDGIEVSGWMMGEGTPIGKGEWTKEGAGAVTWIRTF